MEFVLTGFDQSGSTRKFVFDGIAADRSRNTVVVSADLTMLREFGIQVQSLPLLCRQRLELCDAAELASGQVTITRSDMAVIRKTAQDLADQKKPRKVRVPPSTNSGSAWRGTMNTVLAPKPR